MAWWGRIRAQFLLCEPWFLPFPSPGVMLEHSLVTLLHTVLPLRVCLFRNRTCGTSQYNSLWNPVDFLFIWSRSVLFASNHTHSSFRHMVLRLVVFHWFLFLFHLHTSKAQLKGVLKLISVEELHLEGFPPLSHSTQFKELSGSNTLSLLFASRHLNQLWDLTIGKKP